MIHLLLPLAVIFPAFALHVFITFGLFRKCFTELVGLHELFPDTPIMALTATLLADLKKELITHYLKNPVIVKSTVNRPNIKLCVGDYDFKVEKSTKRKKRKRVWRRMMTENLTRTNAANAQRSNPPQKSREETKH